MRKFKHKTKDITLVKCKNGNSYSSENWEGYYIPSEFVENSCDWDEVKECLFTTEDGVELFGGEKVHLVTDTLLLGVGLNFTKDDFKDKDYLFFAKKENAERYIELNSPKYTVLDMLKVANHYAYIKNVTEDRVLKYLAKNI